jgi:hypothetical protein
MTDASKELLPTDELKKLAERCRLANEAWQRILNMDGGNPQAIAAGMWADLYAHLMGECEAALRTRAGEGE